MKQLIAYYLIFFYAAALLKPVLPLVKDFIAHTFTQEYHIATVHQHDGSKHVHKEIAETTKQSQNEEKAPKINTSEPVSVHLFSTQAESCFPLFTDSDITHSLFLSALTRPVLDKVVPPPRLLPTLS
jgi:hypothetical protein